LLTSLRGTSRSTRRRGKRRKVRGT
jgi:hypothetical protein